MFEINEVVKIKDVGDYFEYGEGKVKDFDGFQYYITNIDMIFSGIDIPFSGNVSDWYFDYELEKKD